MSKLEISIQYFYIIRDRIRVTHIKVQYKQSSEFNKNEDCYHPNLKPKRSQNENLMENNQGKSKDISW